MLKASNCGKRFRLVGLGPVLTGLGCAPAGRQPFIVGMELNYPPFERIDARGPPAGISVELAKALGHMPEPIPSARACWLPHAPQPTGPKRTGARPQILAG